MSGIGLTSNMIQALGQLSRSYNQGSSGWELPSKNLFGYLHGKSHRGERQATSFVRSCRLLCKIGCVTESSAAQTSLYNKWYLYSITPKGMALLDRHVLMRNCRVVSYRKTI